MTNERTTKEAEAILKQLDQHTEDENNRERCCGCGIGEGEDGAYIRQHPETHEFYCEECWSEMSWDYYYNNLGEKNIVEEPN